MTLKLDPTSISEDGGESTVTATLDRATSETVTLTVSATVPGDFKLSANPGADAITAGQTSSTGTVTITAEDNDVDAPAKELTVSAAVTSGPTGLTVPASQTLTITENGGVSTVTALAERAVERRRWVVTVSASAVDPAVANDFMLSGNRELTIEAGQMESTGTGTVTAVNNGVDAPSKTVEVTASVTGGNGVTAPAARTLTITDDEALPVVTLALDPASIGSTPPASPRRARAAAAAAAAAPKPRQRRTTSPAPTAVAAQAAPSRTPAKRRRREKTPEERETISKRMSAYWLRKREEKAAEG